MNCLECLSATNCTVCDTNVSYVLNVSDSLCYPCYITGCTSCNNVSFCLSCDNSINYFYDAASTWGCTLCSLSNCAICTDLVSCDVCAVGFFINNGTMLC